MASTAVQEEPLANTVVELVSPWAAQSVALIPLFPLSTEVHYGALGEGREVGEGVNFHGVAVI